MTVIFACGHEQRVNPDKTPSPLCGACGERKIARVRNVGAPRITGCASGPCVTRRDLEPMRVNLAEKPLPLKDPNHAE